MFKKRQHYFVLYRPDKIPKDFYTHFRNLSLSKLDNQKRFIMNINSMLQKNDIKQTWRIINNIINTKNRKAENILKKIIQDGIVHEGSEDIYKYMSKDKIV